MDRKAVGVLEAKPAGIDAERRGRAVLQLRLRPADHAPRVQAPLPILYESTGVETYFRDERDPEPRSRRVFSFHQPRTLATGWPSPTPCAPGSGSCPLDSKGLRLPGGGYRGAERSLAQARPAPSSRGTGAGKTLLP